MRFWTITWRNKSNGQIVTRTDLEKIAYFHKISVVIDGRNLIYITYEWRR